MIGMGRKGKALITTLTDALCTSLARGASFSFPRVLPTAARFVVVVVVLMVVVTDVVLVVVVVVVTSKRL